MFGQVAALNADPHLKERAMGRADLAAALAAEQPGPAAWCCRARRSEVAAAAARGVTLASAQVMEDPQ